MNLETKFAYDNSTDLSGYLFKYEGAYRKIYI